MEITKEKVEKWAKNGEYKKLVRLLGHDDDEAINLSFEVLSKNLDEKSIGILLKALNNISQPMRWKIVELLGHTTSSASVDSLLGILDDDDMYVRYKAIKSLGMIGTEEAINVLLDSIDHHNKDVAATAAKTLGDLGIKRAVDPLLDCIERGDISTFIINALGMIKEKKAVTSLINLLNDDDWRIRVESKIALARIDTPAALKAIKDFLDEGQIDVKYFCDGPCLFRTERELTIAIVDELRDPLIQGLLILPSNEKSEPYISYLGHELPNRYVHLSTKTYASQDDIKQIYVCNFSNIATLDSGFDSLEGINLFKNTLMVKIFLVNPQLEGLQGYELDPVIKGLKYICSKYFEKVPVTWNFCVDLKNSLKFLNSSEKHELRQRGALNGSVANRILQTR